jgi:hypothetical protein
VCACVYWMHVLEKYELKGCGVVWYGGGDKIKGKDKIVDEGGCRSSSLCYDFLSGTHYMPSN